MTPDDVAQRLYAVCSDRSIALPPSPLTLAVQIICDIIDADDMDENTFDAAALGEITGYVLERVRPLFVGDTWSTNTLDRTALEILRHVEHMLIRLEKERQP